MKENLDIFDFKLTKAEMVSIASLATGTDPIYGDHDLEIAKAIGTY